MKIELVKDTIWLDGRPFARTEQLSVVRQYEVEVGEQVMLIRCGSLEEAERVAKPYGEHAHIFEKLTIATPWIEITHTNEEEDEG